MRADLDTLVIAVYCAACSLFPAARKRQGRPQQVTDNELLCLMVAQMLLGQPSDRRFLAVAKRRLGHLFPTLPSQSRYNERCRQLAPKLVTLWRAIAYELPGFHDSLSFVDTTPLPCGQSVSTVNRSELAPGAASVTPPLTPASSGGCGSCSGVAQTAACATSTSSPPTRPSVRPCSSCSSDSRPPVSS